MKFKERLGFLLLPIARFYMRYLRIPLFRKKLWDNFNWRNKTFISRTQFGSRMAGQTQDLIQGFIYYFGIWEPNLTSWIMERLTNTQDRVFLDVGSNIGYYSILASRLLGKSGHVVSIEASPNIYKLLVNNIKLNRLINIRSVCCAATEKKEQVKLYQGDSRNIGATTTVPGKYDEERAIEVMGKPLSQILREDEVKKIKLVKMDVEGAEWSALQGLYAVFDDLPSDIEFIIETSPEITQTHNINAQKIIDMFTEYGFHAYFIENSYDPDEYLFPKKISRPSRLHKVPNNAVDIIFSRIDNESL